MNMLLTGGLVVDGTGAPPRQADVLIRDGKIAEPGATENADNAGNAAPPAEVRDVTGSVVCPGFVDIHTHSDLTVLSNPLAHSKVHQGVTTEVVGNCGLGLAPLPELCDVDAIRKAVSYLDLDPDVPVGWQDFAGYLDTVAAARPSHRIAGLTAHLPLHAGVVGFADKKPDRTQLKQMGALLAESFEQGSLGLSTGLVYAPLCFAAQDELVELAGVCQAHDRVFTWHLRDYGGALLHAVREAIGVADRTGARVQLSHLVAVGRRNWGSVARALELVDKAIDRGVQVGVDVYPYLYGNAPLAQLLPGWAQDGGPDEMAARLSDPAVRDRIRTEWQDNPLRWDEITISRVPQDSPVVGQTVSGDEQALDLLAQWGTGVLMVAHGRSQADLDAVLSHPAAVVASDGLCLDPSGVTGAGAPHPRSYGCFPRFLAGQQDLAAAVARCTSAPARLAGLDTGVLRPGAAADLVVFTPDRLADRATPADPQRYPDGIELVLVGGEPVVDGGVHTGARPGSVLRA